MSTDNKSNDLKPTIIQSIETFEDPGRWMGYKIIMSDSDKNITFKIENLGNCCEKWGMYTKNNLTEFIGAQYYSVSIGKPIIADDMMSIIKIKINTDKGRITLQLYNQHNGYYPHDVFIQSEKGISNIRL
jgi:hypothetical protein